MPYSWGMNWALLFQALNTIGLTTTTAFVHNAKSQSVVTVVAESAEVLEALIVGVITNKAAASTPASTSTAAVSTTSQSAAVTPIAVVPTIQSAAI